MLRWLAFTHSRKPPKGYGNQSTGQDKEQQESVSAQEPQHHQPAADSAPDDKSSAVEQQPRANSPV